MSLFGGLKKAFGAATREVQADYSENKDFLEAVCAAAALVAMADGSIDESEKKKAISLIGNHSVLSKMYRTDVIEATADTMFKRAKDSSGRQSLARELDDIKGRPNGTQMAEDVYLVAVDVANADGTLAPEEDAVLKKIAARLNIDPSKFEF